MIENNEVKVPIELDKIFDYVEIKTEFLQNLVERVVLVISKSTDVYEKGFGPLIEGKIIGGLGGGVTEDGDIKLDSTKLREHDEDIAMAIIAHEFAHHYLDHYIEPNTDESGLKAEAEADELAKKWGFDIDKFRRTCGPPTLQNNSPIA